MKNKELALRIKNLRSRKGFSQEELADKTGLSLRTIQRIENGETEPRGDSLKRLAAAFDVAPDEIMDWTVEENNGFLTSLNLAALTFIIFPILGILVPLIMWISKKDKIKGINSTAKSILNFQITWVMVLFVGYSAIVASIAYAFESEQNISSSIIRPRMLFMVVFFAVMYLYNLTLIIINIVKSNQQMRVRYIPGIPFLGR
ncbi:helix-turn-helix domain-containing protein [Fulvivirga ligni]|uniref:helix-turn-helix domain-containing protein n=1 Tax=Fulvivirga ligni TaxID=2904246 RepID=UPI001F30D755|nr:helix-turn-helix domain-containing protein [Fulvivirga ligni]UII21354.1 helix-turn-helix domain-containing protein [Fulvivirga ligni]